MKKDLTLSGLGDSISYLEAKGLSKCFDAYANACGREEIMEVGFRQHSGYTYISLENGITIGSMLGQDVEYLVTHFESGEELFFDTYMKAESSTELFQ